MNIFSSSIFLFLMVSVIAVECLRACSRDFFSLLKLLRCQINWVLKMIYLLWKNWLSKIHHKTLSSVLHYELGIPNSSMDIRIRYSMIRSIAYLLIQSRFDIWWFEYRIFHYSIPIRYSNHRIFSNIQVIWFKQLTQDYFGWLLGDSGVTLDLLKGYGRVIWFIA